MLHSIDFLKTLIVEHRSIEYLIILLGTALGGEFALFVLGFLAAQHVVGIIPSAILSFLGAFLPNMIWFLLGSTNIVSRATPYRRTDTTFSIITEAVQRVSNGSHLSALIIIKFLIGTPVLLVMYTAKTGLRAKKFFFYQSVATILSMLVLMPIGYLSGRGFSYLSQVFQNIYAALGFLLLIIVAGVMLQIWFERTFTQEKK